MKLKRIITFPTYFTLLRLIVGPCVIPYLIVHHTQTHNFLMNIGIAIIFLLFACTDFLDGFFARRYRLESKLGAVLDHLADKFLTFSAFIAFVAVDKLHYFWAIIFIGREFFMMGLREIALESGMQIKVSSWGKIKTVLHFVLILCMILNPMQYGVVSIWNQLEFLLLIIAVMISVTSGLHYFINFYSALKK